MSLRPTSASVRPEQLISVVFVGGTVAREASEELIRLSRCLTTVPSAFLIQTPAPASRSPQGLLPLKTLLALPSQKFRWLNTALMTVGALRWVTRWSMVEVFMLGILIAVVRSAGVTDVVLGAGLFGYAMLTVLLTAMQASGLHALWPEVRA